MSKVLFFVLGVLCATGIMSLKENSLITDAREAAANDTPFAVVSTDGVVVLMNERAAVLHALKLAIEKNRDLQRGPLAPTEEVPAILTEIKL